MLVSTRSVRSRKRHTKPASLSDCVELAQLTVDQYLDSKQEAKHFTDPSHIRRFKDAFGTEIGPYRLWVPGQKFPGLKVARSLGDFGLEELGLRHTPIVQKVELHPNRDRSLIVGTDGLWSVMDNKEVGVFVEEYRKSCTILEDDEEVIETEGRVDVKNATSCRLLCEEARKRWLEIMKNYDVDSDDISAIVLEFTQAESRGPSESERPLLTEVSLRNRESRRIIRSDKVEKLKENRPVQCPERFDGRRRSVIPGNFNTGVPMVSTNSFLRSQQSSIRRLQSTLRPRPPRTESITSQRPASVLRFNKTHDHLTMSSSQISINPQPNI